MDSVLSDKFQNVRSWLNGPKNYQQGVMLLRVYWSDQNTIRSLDKWQNEKLLNDTMLKLYEELKAKLDAIAVEEVPAKKKPIERAAPVAVEIVHTQKRETASGRTLKKVDDIIKARTQLYKERGKWHAELCAIAYDESGKEKEVLTARDIERRYELAKLIIGHTEQIDKYWSMTDYFEINGVLPQEVRKRVPKKPKLTNAEALAQLKNSVAPNLSKNKKKLADAQILLPNLTGKDHDKLKAKMAEWQSNITILEAEKKELSKQINE